MHFNCHFAGRVRGIFGTVIRTFILSVISLPTYSLSEAEIEIYGGERNVVPLEPSENAQIIRSTPPSSDLNTGDSRLSAKTITHEAIPEKKQKLLRVGPDRKLKYTSDAAKIARDGYLIEIDSGVYRNDYARWPQNNLTIRGVGGMAHLQSTGLIPNRKAIWITRGNNIEIENIEFSGAAVENTNGAGIRHEGGNLTLSNTFFHDNEFSLLSGRLPDADIEILSSRFWFQKRPARHSHGIYIGEARRFTLMGSHIKGTDQGHQVKSRALENHILYNRIEDIQGGNSSRLVDLSNCGFSIVMGNDLHQAATTRNTNVIGYGSEGCTVRTAKQKKLYVINNTLVNEAANGTLVNNHTEGDAFVANNVVFGRGDFLLGSGVSANNFREASGNRIPGKWDVPEGSKAIDSAARMDRFDGLSLIPAGEFTPPAGYRRRLLHGNLDAGSREYSRHHR